MKKVSGYSLQEAKQLATSRMKDREPNIRNYHKRSQTQQSAILDTSKTPTHQHHQSYLSYLHERQGKSRFIELPKHKDSRIVDFHLINITNTAGKPSHLGHKKLSSVLELQRGRSLKQNRSPIRNNTTKSITRRLPLNSSGGLGSYKKLKSWNIKQSGEEGTELRMKLQVLAENDVGSWMKEIKRICSCLKELIQYGISDKKVSKWCEIYFQQKKKGLLEIFMNKKTCKKSLNDQINYEAILDEPSLAQSISFCAQELGEKEKYFLGIQITQYRNFLEQKIASKQKLELGQIEGKIRHNLNNIFLKSYARELAPPPSGTEIHGFYAQLQRVEEAHGKLSLLSLKNRKKYQNITESEQNIWAMIRS